MVKEYYAQRASVPGTLVIAEATYISEKAIGEAHTSGLWLDKHIAAWKDITDAVHASGSFIYCQLSATGRAAQQDVVKAQELDYVSSSATPMQEGGPVPRALSEPEILEYIADYVQAARNAVAAGFNGVEIHGANGYLIDQFTQDTCNRRTDHWGGSVENRARFAVEVVRAVSDAIGGDRTATRLSPYSTFQGMRMKDPRGQFSYLAEQLKQFGLAYPHIVQPRISGADDMKNGLHIADEAFLPQVWANSSPLFIAGGFTAESAASIVSEDLYRDKDVVVVFDRHFIANPDLPFRIANNVAFTKYDRSTFYTPMQSKGYTDYAFSPQYLSKIRA
jgi:NADPH2 dehydrogenase